MDFTRSNLATIKYLILTFDGESSRDFALTGRVGSPACESSRVFLVGRGDQQNSVVTLLNHLKRTQDNFVLRRVTWILGG